MDTIVFCSNPKQKASGLYHMLCQNLPNHRLVTTISSQKIAVCGCGQELLLVRTDKIPAFAGTATEHLLLVFDESFQSEQSVSLSSGMLCVAASDNTALLQLLASCHAHVITCGMSPKDTFTYSGKNENSISVSLQRELLSRSGDKIEPMEMVFSFSKAYADYDLLAYAAVSVLLGSLPTDNSNHLIL